MSKKLLSLLVAIISTGAFAQVELLTDGSFETGVLGSWTITTVNGADGGPTSCSENFRVQADSIDLCCCVAEVTPSDGSFAAYTSFDSGIADTQWILEQQVSIPATIVAADLSFDFAANFDFGLGSPITSARVLSIDVYRTDGTPLSNLWTDSFIDPGAISVAYSQTIDASGLLSGVEGMDAIIRITATIPEPATGPGKAMIDNVSFIVDDGLGVNDLSLADAITIAPNPSNGVFGLTYTGNEALTQAVIYDVSGKQLAQYDLSNLQGSLEIATDLPTGFYLLNVQSETSQISKKLIIR